MAKKRPRSKSAKPVAARRLMGPARTQQIQGLLHELQVHAEEITAQNEQLLKAQGELEDARDRFADLYDFAPIGYASLNAAGAITEINLAGAALLGKARAFLINMPMASLVKKDHRQALDRFLERARDRESGEQSTELASRIDGQRIIRLIARPGLTGASGDLFTAMVDVTEERRLADERRDALRREQELAAARATEIRERTAAEARIKMLLERLVGAQEEERRRIARNLHDHLGQQLTALRLTLDALRNEAAMPDALRQRVALVEGIVSKIDRDVDLLAWDLRPATLDDVGLPAALSELVRQWTTVSEVPAEFHQSTPGEFRLAPDSESNVYRIVQEALNNIAKHAGATQVSVLIEHRGDEMAVIIEDNGRGFDPDRILKSRERHAVMGLLGMRERAALIDGEVQIESRPGQGTTVFVRVPVKQRSG